MREFVESYERGLNAYLARDFCGSKEYYEIELKVRPKDPGVLRFLERIKNINPKTLPPDRDGSTALKEK